MTNTQPTSRTELLGKIEDGWNALQAYLKTLSNDQLTRLTDAQGWTVKDHLTHLVVWEDGMNALLEKQPRGASMGLDAQTWESGDFDKMNAVIQQHQKDRSLAEVLKKAQEVHERLLNNLRALTDEDLARPYLEFQTGSTWESPVINTLIGNTYAHFEEHRPWIETIVKTGKDAG